MGSTPAWAGRSRSRTACGRSGTRRCSRRSFRSPAAISSRWPPRSCRSSLFLAYLDWSQPIRMAAGGIVAAFGVYKLLNRRHPRIAARLGPKHLTLWSFLTATAHGAGLMLAPIVARPLREQSSAAPSPALDRGHEAMSELMRSGIATSIAVSGGSYARHGRRGRRMAWIVYRWAGLGSCAARGSIWKASGPRALSSLASSASHCRARRGAAGSGPSGSKARRAGIASPALP